MYDIFYIGPDDAEWKKIKQKYPLAKRVDDFQTAQKKSFTIYFWVVWKDISVVDTFLFDYKVSKWDTGYIHVFRNGKFYDGVCLFPKKAVVSKKELDYRFFINKKEVDILASTPKPYDKFNISSYQEYLDAVKNSSTDMFWAVWPDIDVLQTFAFDYIVPKHNSNVVHIFKNGEYYDGVCLFPKHKIITNREFTHRFFINKKEVDIQASTPKPYDIFYIGAETDEWKKIKQKFPLAKRVDDFQTAQTISTTTIFWIVWDDIIVSDDFNFDFNIPEWDASYIHVFRNGNFYDGICLFSKTISISNKELDFRWFAHKKEIDIVASNPTLFDIVFISYHEPDADLHYKTLTNKLTRTVHRVDGVNGIHNAHKQAATLVNTDMFWVVDADAIIVDNFNFDYQVIRHNYNTVYVWRSRNPVNGLEYGYGGVKLLPTKETLNMDVNSTDMTTSISSKFQAIPDISNITAFNTDPFSSWRSAFRECCKLAVIGDAEALARLNRWCTIGSDIDAINGALAGRKYGQENAANQAALSMINDFTWLKDQWSLEISQQ